MKKWTRTTMSLEICFITFEYPPLVIGGAGVYALHIVRGLAKLGHRVHVITPSINRQEVHSIEKNDIFVHRMPTLHGRFTSSPSFWFSLMRKYSRNYEFDVIHSNDTSDFSLFRWQVKAPRVVTIHHLAYLMAQNTPFRRRLFHISGETAFTPFIQKIVISRADRIIAVSNFTKKAIVSTYDINPSKIEVIPHGIDANEYLFSKNDIKEFRMSIGLSEDFTFLFVGRLDDPRKNVNFLLKAFQILTKSRKESAKLLLVGAGGLKVKEEAKALGILDKVIFLGYVDDVTLKKCYAASNVFVSPSLLEGFGLTILEAMAAAKPVIALNRGAVGELVRNGVNNILVDKEDPRTLANAMIFFLDHPDIIESVGARNREYVVKNFNWEKSAKLTERAYRSVINKDNVVK